MNGLGKRPAEEENAPAENKKPKVTQRRHHGLQNQGATCYLNSVLQVLFMTPEIHNRLDPEAQITDRLLRNVFGQLEETTCGTEKITEHLGIQNVYEQGDAAECLEMILQKVSPRASKVFQGELANITACSKGHSINKETNPFWILPLSLQGADDAVYSVEKGLERIFQPRSFSRVHCKECEEKTDVTIECEMQKPPQILTLLLKRFAPTSYFKSNCCVDVPLTLHVKGRTYALYGMVNHVGSRRSGHYVATLLSDEDQTWYECDDARVSRVKEQPFAKTRTHNSSSAYLLLYRARKASGSLRDKDRGQTREKRTKRTSRHQEDGGKPEKKSLLRPKQNISSQPESRTTAERRKQRRREAEGEDSAQACPSPASIRSSALCVSLIAVGAVLVIVILCVLITSL